MKFIAFFLLVIIVFWGRVPLQAAELNTVSTLTDTQPSSSISKPEPRFDPVIDDLPLMSGLTAVPDEATLFDEPHAGRIAETVAVGTVDIDDVYRYYRRTLPHLGWQIVDARTYHRGAEKLRIDAHADGKVTTVHFSIKPD